MVFTCFIDLENVSGDGRRSLIYRANVDKAQESTARNCKSHSDPFLDNPLSIYRHRGNMDHDDQNFPNDHISNLVDIVNRVRSGLVLFHSDLDQNGRGRTDHMGQIYCVQRVYDQDPYLFDRKNLLIDHFRDICQVLGSVLVLDVLFQRSEFDDRVQIC